jgi:hypothetical protein
MRAVKFALVVVLASFTAGCAYIGDVKPPTLDIPVRVIDFRAAEFGDKITGEFTLAPLTTEGLALKNVRGVELRVSGGADRTIQIAPKDPGTFAFDTPAADFVGKNVILAVRAIGPKGKASEWSNLVTMDVQPPLAMPENVAAVNAPKGVHVTWNLSKATGSAPHYRIFRALPGGTPQSIGESDVPEYEDASVAMGTMYRYRVQAINGDLHQSEVSAEAAVTPEDVFPPAVPSELSGVQGVGAIELVWQRNAEEDFAGYNVFRAAGAGEFEKIAGPIDAPAYSDRSVEAGKTYRYTVSAVDRTGNESARTPVVEVIAP